MEMSHSTMVAWSLCDKSPLIPLGSHNYLPRYPKIGVRNENFGLHIKFEHIWVDVKVILQYNKIRPPWSNFKMVGLNHHKIIDFNMLPKYQSPIQHHRLFTLKVIPYLRQNYHIRFQTSPVATYSGVLSYCTTIQINYLLNIFTGTILDMEKQYPNPLWEISLKTVTYGTKYSYV